MSDSKTELQPQDASKVNPDLNSDIQYWKEKFSCTEEELKNAVKTVGTTVKKVQEFLRKGW